MTTKEKKKLRAKRKKRLGVEGEGKNPTPKDVTDNCEVKGDGKN